MAIQYSEQFKAAMLDGLLRTKHFKRDEQGRVCARFDRIEISNDPNGGLAVKHLLEGEFVFTHNIPGMRLTPDATICLQVGESITPVCLSD